MEDVGLGRRRGSSSFAAACSALSQYIKAKGSVADLGLPAAVSPEGKMEEPQTPATKVQMPCKEISGGLRYGATASAMDADAREPEKAPLTIFYGGRVLVFDGFPADKVKNLMQLAREGTSAAILDAHPAGTCNPDYKSMAPPVCNSDALQREPKKLDLPIARKASLKRFLEKRKDRFDAKAPYESLARMKSEKSKSSKSWLSLEH